MFSDYLSILKALLASLAVGLIFVGMTRLGYAITADVAFISLVTIFTLVFFSNRVTQISGPGGVSANFQQVASAPAASQTISSSGAADGEEFIAVSKRGLDELENITRQLSEGDYVALRLRMGHAHSRYDPYQVVEYVRGLAASTKNSWVIVVDQRDRFVAATDANSFLKLNPDHVHQIIEVIQQGDLRRLQRIGFFHQASASLHIDNREALRQMSDKRIDFLVLLDDQKVPKRIATRGQIVERLLLALAR